MAVMAVAEGASVITETIFENRFMHVSELARLGADITVRGNAPWCGARTSSRARRSWPPTCAPARASSWAVSGAQGETIVNRIYHLDRGYEQMEKKLQALGADIERVV